VAPRRDQGNRAEFLWPNNAGKICFNNKPLVGGLAFNAVIEYNIQLDETTMATLTIRNIDAAVKERLRVRAARHGRSMQAELRSIISEAVEADRDQPEPNLAEAIRRRFAPLGGVDLEPHPPVPASDPATFDS
jgi:plasmid stability protein